jgi:hypothetical protein
MDIKHMKIKKTLPSLFITVMLIFAGMPLTAAAAETPEKTFTGDANAAAILKNLDFADVRQSDTWAKDAIYEAGALEIIKGMKNMDRRFGRTDTLSREEAIALAYRAAGREAEGQQLGENLNNARAAADKKTDPVAVWYDGFLQLAANEALITRQDLTSALNTDQNSLEATDFRRNAPVQRQELAYWLARTLNLQPVRGQQNLFNNYTDWQTADPEKIPYIEAVLQNGIMNDNGSGRFNPAQAVTREQAAQIVKNAESQVLAALKYIKNTGTIESISASSDYSAANGTGQRIIGIRSSNGKLHEIKVSPPASAGGARNEQAGTPAAGQSRELVVYKAGQIGNSSLLKAGDRLEYITNAADSVKFVNVLSNANDTRYMVAQVKSLDTSNRLMNVLQFFKLDYPDISALSRNVSISDGKDAVNASYRYSEKASVTINGFPAKIGDVSPDSTVILTIASNNIVTAVQSVNLGINAEERNIVRGIVEDNNPQLGYITLYNEDGTGTGRAAADNLAAVRTYSYTDQNKLEILRNHAAAKLDSIQTGDTAYLRLNEDGDVISISAVDNYSVMYGKVLSRQSGDIIVQYDNGLQQILKIDNSVLVIQDKKLTSLKALKDGDRVRLIVNMNNKSTDLKEITIEGSEHFITNIYKGIISNMDDTSGKLSILNLQAFNRGKWEKTDRKGFTAIPLSDEYRLYYGDREMDMRTANRLLNSNEAYIAVEADYGGTEKAVVISYRNSDDTEVSYSDSIANMVSGAGTFTLLNKFEQIRYDAGSIVVKYGRLVSGNSLADDDKAYLAVNRSYNGGELNASVIKVDEPSTQPGNLYRARIKSINENQDFTVESFSQLTGSDWKYYNTPKTFKLTFNTRLLGDNGVVNIREFTGYGSDSYLNRVVYIMADGANALLISTAPYGTVSVRGTVYEVTGAEIGEEGTLTKEPNGLVIRKVKTYSPTKFTWSDDKDMTLGILQNSIIAKNGRIIRPSEIKKGDTVTVIRKDAAVTGDACIILVE